MLKMFPNARDYMILVRRSNTIENAQCYEVNLPRPLPGLRIRISKYNAPAFLDEMNYKLSLSSISWNRVALNLRVGVFCKGTLNRNSAFDRVSHSHVGNLPILTNACCFSQLTFLVGNLSLFGFWRL